MNQSTNPSRTRSSAVAAAIGAPKRKIPKNDASTGNWLTTNCHQKDVSTKEDGLWSKDALCEAASGLWASGSGVGHLMLCSRSLSTQVWTDSDNQEMGIWGRVIKDG